ncbi:AraC family transcriptional regulator [Streptomyces sp. NPDC058751]|uniref:AraC family transcriptional regulator n=1 Tax=Streptomyces sp. NPDC058751 TaxID=3346623 RepID=UPI0036C19B3E
MIGTVFRSEEIPAQDRFGRWQELIGRTRYGGSVRVADADAADFWAEGKVMELGAVTMLSMAFLPSRYLRNHRMIRQSDPELYHLSLLLDGELALDHAGRSATFAAHDLHMVDSSQPYDLRPVDAYRNRVVRGVGVDIPKELLPLPPRRIQELLGRAMPGRDGVGALLSDFLVGVVRQADTLRPSDAPRLGEALLDLLSVWSAQLLDAKTDVPPEARRRAMTESIRAFIRRNLHDPELTPPVIAAAHHISLSYLHRVFQQEFQGDTVAAHIRALRMEGARRDLADPALHGTPIHAVAARWGFPRASDFTRAFRAAHGCSPREFRFRPTAEWTQRQEPGRTVH